MNVATLTRQNPTVTPAVTPAVPHPADAPPRSKRVRASPRWLLQRLALGLTLLFLVLPVAFLLATSFKSRDEVLSGYFFPLAPTLLNWLLVALLALFITLAIAVPAVYAVVKLRHGQRLAGWLLSSYLSPPVVALLPLFFVWRQAGLTNSTFGLALVDGLSNVPVAFWLLRGFFKQVPLALDEAAWLEGVGPWKTLWRVNLPLIWPGLTATAIICLILSYNEFLFASVLNSRPDLRTITVAISLFEGERVVNFGQMAAASLLGIAPVYALALWFQKHLIGGLGAAATLEHTRRQP